MWCATGIALLQLQFSVSKLPSVGLCFSLFDFLGFSSRRVGRGLPSTSRAFAFTALTALNFAFLRLRGISFTLVSTIGMGIPAKCAIIVNGGRAGSFHG